MVLSMMPNYKIKSDIKEAMIFAAGRGSRMRYNTKYKAKPLIKITNEELLKINLNKIASSGIRTCVVNSSYKHISIKKFIKNFKFKNNKPKVYVSHEIDKLDTGGGFKLAKKYFSTNNVLLVNGDSLLTNHLNDCPIKKLSDNFLSNKMDILLLLSSISNSVGYTGNGDYIKKFKGRPSLIERKCKHHKDNNAFIFTGWQIINKTLLSQVTKNKFSLNILYDLAEKNKRLYGINHEGSFLHLSTPKSLSQIENYLRFQKVKVL